MTMIQLGLTELAVGLVMFFGIYGGLEMGIKAEFEAKKKTAQDGLFSNTYSKYSKSKEATTQLPKGL